MRIRSALAVIALTAAVTATGAATAAADDNGSKDRDHVACSPYFGELETVTSEIEWGGAVCHNGPFDI
jgi:hypothetical protein